jgi:hypothetical protein
MRWLDRSGSYAAVAVLVLAATVLLSAAGQLPNPAATEAAPAPSAFEGRWRYNAQDSLNVATGRPEQAPRSATQRGGTRSGPTLPSARRGSDRGGYGGGIGVSRQPDIGPTPAMVRASRDLMRDLLEIPESLTITVKSDSVAFVDDIDRERTYPTDGSKRDYHLGASQFGARVEWRNSQLRMDIQGDFGFRMNETYFLSPDGQRLFVILRVGGTSPDAPIGADRVYDRVAPGLE